MEETDLSQLSDIEITDMYSDIIEGANLLAKVPGLRVRCTYYCDAQRAKHQVCPVGNGTYYDMFTGDSC